MRTIHNSIGQSKECHIEVWDDWSHQSARPHFRAFWVAPGASTGSPVVGYCSPGGSWPTVRQVVAECRKLGYRSDDIYRNGRLLSAGE